MNDDFHNPTHSGESPLEEQPQNDAPVSPNYNNTNPYSEPRTNAPHPNYGYPYTNVQSSGPSNPFQGGQPQQQQYQSPVQPSGGAPYESTPQKPKKPKKKGLLIFLGCILLCLVLALTGVILALTLGENHKKPQKPTAPDVTIGEAPQSPLQDADGQLTAKGVYAKVKDSSVGILVYKNNAFSNTALAGQGSGVIIAEDKKQGYTYIVTCAHVISGGETVSVQLHDETQYDASIIGYDSRTDIGVVRIKATGLTICELGDSEKLSVGDPVYAIGNPGGVSFAGSFTDGMISAIARPVNSEIGYEMLCIQHTAAINPGNSGGALVNAAGQLVGINSSKIAGEGFEGMGFSVPTSTMKEVFDEIVKNGYVTNRPKLGIRYFPAAPNQMYGMIVGVNHLPAGTIVIQTITSDSDLNGKGIQKGDMITKVNGKPLDTPDILPDIIEDSHVGDVLKLTICRVDTQKNYELHEFDVEVKLVEDRGETATVKDQSQEHEFYNPFENFPFGK